MAELLGLPPAEIKLGQKGILEARRAEDQTPALVSLILFCFQRTVSSLAIKKAQEKWEPTGRLRDLVRIRCGQLMLDPATELITATMHHKRCIERGLERLMGLWMKADEMGSLRPHTPSGYTDGDDSNHDKQGPAAAFEVNKFMKEIMKYNRSNFQTKLLLEIIPVANTEPVAPIPNIMGLIARLTREFLVKDNLRSDRQVYTETPKGQRYRIAYLRWHTAHVYASTGKQCQWKQINRQLYELREIDGFERKAYQKAFYKLIMRRDAATFTGTNTWADLQLQGEKFEIPTEQDIRNQMADAATPAHILPATETGL